jgi:putative endonuclease
MKQKGGWIYVLGSRKLVLYVGVTTDLQKRLLEHKNGVFGGFTKRYNVDKLLYFERYENIGDAIKREKQLKNWHRGWKLNLISGHNPTYRDLSEDMRS